jgi:hypothetical protein
LSLPTSASPRTADGLPASAVAPACDRPPSHGPSVPA